MPVPAVPAASAAASAVHDRVIDLVDGNDEFGILQDNVAAPPRAAASTFKAATAPPPANLAPSDFPSLGQAGSAAVRCRAYLRRCSMSVPGARRNVFVAAARHGLEVLGACRLSKRLAWQKSWT